MERSLTYVLSHQRAIGASKCATIQNVESIVLILEIFAI